MNLFLSISAALFFLLLALPLFQTATGLLKSYPLVGMEDTAPPPTRSLSAWWNGTLQSEFDAWLNQRVGLRDILVRTANQINYRLFRELPWRGDNTVRMGRRGFLYSKPYWDTYNGAKKEAGASLPEVSASLRRLQDRLAADGIALLLVIAPSKAEIYPEFLPEVADVAGRPGRRTVYQDLVELLRRDGVNLVDAHELFLEWKQAPGAPLLYTQGGIHWNHYGAARVVAQIMDRLRELTGKDLPALQVTGAVTNSIVAHADNDLGELVNIWSGPALAGPQIHPVLETRAGTLRPDILLVGDSFGSTLTFVMDGPPLYRQRDYYFYYNRNLSYPDHKDVPLDRKQLHLLKQVRGRDAILIEVCEIFLPQIGFGFVEDLLGAYDALDSQARSPVPEHEPAEEKGDS